ncbi:transporter [Pseudomonas sp. WN033]|nr:transporter [Pseudomonas sp. WN033]
MNNLSLLPGWAQAAASMQPLAAALSEELPGWQVATHELPAVQMSSLETDLSELAERLPPGVLVGWSLGGMLAMQLQRRFPERFPQVVTIASNACFVAREDWPEAMAAATFKAFLNDFRQQPDKTLKRFALLVTQGSDQARSLSRMLSWDQADEEQRLHALALLGVLDHRNALKNNPAASLHCLAARDALVPGALADHLRTLAPGVRLVVHGQASHALPLEQPAWLAARIGEFLEARDA